MWTTPSYKVLGIDLIRSFASICPAFSRARLSAGQDGFRDVGSSQVFGLEEHWGYRIFLRPDRSITPSAFLASSGIGSARLHLFAPHAG
jgi:hypothetical protein